MPRVTIINTYTPANPWGETDANNIGTNLLYILDEETVFNSNKDFKGSIILSGNAGGGGKSFSELRLRDNFGGLTERARIGLLSSNDNSLYIESLTEALKINTLNNQGVTIGGSLTSENGLITLKGIDGAGGESVTRISFNDLSDNTQRGQIGAVSSNDNKFYINSNTDDLLINTLNNKGIIIGGTLTSENGLVTLRGISGGGGKSVSRISFADNFGGFTTRGQIGAVSSNDDALYIDSSTDVLKLNRLNDKIVELGGALRCYGNAGGGGKSFYEISFLDDFDSNTQRARIGLLSSNDNSFYIDSISEPLKLNTINNQDIDFGGNILPTSTPTEETISRTTTGTTLLPRGVFSILLKTSRGTGSIGADETRLALERFIDGSWFVLDKSITTGATTSNSKATTGTYTSSGSDLRINLTYDASQLTPQGDAVIRKS